MTTTRQALHISGVAWMRPGSKHAQRLVRPPSEDHDPRKRKRRRGQRQTRQ